MIRSMIVNVLIVWFRFSRILFLELKRMLQDIFTYFMKQQKELRKTYLRNILLIFIYVLISFVYIKGSAELITELNSVIFVF